MAYVKLDSGILNSTLWMERAQRELFITALLMAQPMELKEPAAQLKTRSLEETGFVVPPGWYGFVPAAGIGIINVARMPKEEGMQALEELASEDEGSRSQDFGGRRLVRIDGGYLVLNFMKYRDKDHTAATRSKRYRMRKKAAASEGKDRLDIKQGRPKNPGLFNPPATVSPTTPEQEEADRKYREEHGYNQFEKFMTSKD